ncbi:hypothetical protein BDC45DRAFT_511364 [Circinella umbellata]|nr:hypothetical protein BDC45DRAFT_511364 [Circinella umbellata]
MKNSLEILFFLYGLISSFIHSFIKRIPLFFCINQKPISTRPFFFSFINNDSNKIYK